MKRLVAVALLATLLIGLAPIPVHAGGAVNAALALGAFAVLSPFLVLGALAQPFYAPPYYAPAPAVYATTPTYASAPAYPIVVSAPATRPPAVQREVVYAQGRHVLLGDGVTSAYRWVWVPNPPAGTPPAPPSR
jgi:hypothetical protein